MICEWIFSPVALSKKSSSCLAHMITTQSHILEDLKRIGIEVILCGRIEVFFFSFEGSTYID